MNPLSSDRMTPPERLDEVARLLALAILRRRERTKNASDPGLDFGARVRLHVTPEGGRV